MTAPVLGSVTSRADPQAVQLLDEATLDPKMEYRWAHNDPLRIANLTRLGYRLVSRDKDGVETIVDNGKSPDDRIYNGDSVLMCCDRERVAERREYNRRVTEMRLGSPVETFRRRHQQSGAHNSKVLVDEEGE